MLPPFLRAADGIAWAILILAMLFVLATVLIAAAIWAEGAPFPRFDTYLFAALLTAVLVTGPLAFHRRRWWAWDLAISLVLIAWILAPLNLARQFAPAVPPAGTALGRAIVMGMEILFFAIPLPALTVVLCHGDVRRAFPHPLPVAPRLTAAYLVAAAPLHLLGAVAADPNLFFGTALPRWGLVLWSFTSSSWHLAAGFGLYHHRPFGRPLAFFISTLILIEAAAGLFHPGLSCLPANFGYPTLANSINLLFGLAMLVAILLPAAPELPELPFPADSQELRR